MSQTESTNVTQIKWRRVLKSQDNKRHKSGDERREENNNKENMERGEENETNLFRSTWFKVQNGSSEFAVAIVISCGSNTCIGDAWAILEFAYNCISHLDRIGHGCTCTNLKKGTNEILISLANDFFGWGLVARLNNMDGITDKMRHAE